MADLSERVQRQIDRLLDQCEEAISKQDWETARGLAGSVLRMDAANRDALAYLAAADPETATLSAGPEANRHPARAEPSATPELDRREVRTEPTSFQNGRYQVRRFLGEGGKKRVFLTHDSQLDRDVAFALLKSDGLDIEGLARIRREAQAMGRLGDHPHIVTVFDIGEEAGQPYIVSQFMAGGDLAGLIAQAPDHRLPLDDVLKISDQILQALDHAHAHGVIHRDLKPGNVWLSGSPSPQPSPATGGGDRTGTASPHPNPLPEGEGVGRGRGGLASPPGRGRASAASPGEGWPSSPVAKLGDFGLAISLDRSRLTQAGMMVGTVSYMAPEQALGHDVTPRSDLYSLGCMLYELVTGRPPFIGDESVAIITQHLNTPPISPSWHVPDVPAGLETLILRLLEKDPEKRPVGASEVRSMLGSVATASPQPHPTPPRSPLPGGEGAGRASAGEGASLDPTYRRVFIGRENELRQLQQAFDRALSGQGSIAILASTLLPSCSITIPPSEPTRSPTSISRSPNSRP